MFSDQVQYSIINNNHDYINGPFNLGESSSSLSSSSSIHKNVLGSNSSNNNNNNSFQVIYNWVENICKQTLVDPKNRHLQMFSWS